MNTVETFKLENPQIEAELYYLTEEEGGRKTPVGNGYRGQFYYNGKDWDAPQQFMDKMWCNPVLNQWYNYQDTPNTIKHRRNTRKQFN